MLIQCTYGPVSTEVMGTTYTFAPDEFGRNVAEVWNPKHIEALVAVIHYQVVQREPVPLELTEISPTEAVMGGPDVLLNCVGTGFTKHSLIIFNGGVEPTTYVSDELLTTTVKPSTATTAGSYPVLVREGEEESAAFDFTFTESAAPEEEPEVEVEAQAFEQKDDLVDESTEDFDDGGPIPVTNINGIGPTTASKLAEVGITDARQIAELSREDADSLDTQLGLGGRIARDGWVEQAKALVA